MSTKCCITKQELTELRDILSEFKTKLFVWLGERVLKGTLTEGLITNLESSASFGNILLYTTIGGTITPDPDGFRELEELILSITT